MNIRRIDFPELTAVLTACQNTFSGALLANFGNTTTMGIPVCEMHFPKLKTFRMNTSAQTFNSLQNQTTTTYRRKYKLYLDAVTNITGGTTAPSATFNTCHGMTDIYFNSLSSITNTYMFNACPELTGIHFGAANEAAIKATTGYSTLWGRGAGNATVTFELPAV